METKYPRFRTDLVISQQTEGGKTHFVIKDPITRRFFRFKQFEYYIAHALDGTTSLEEIRQCFEDEFDVSLPSAKLERYVDRLRGLCLLESDLTEREISKLQGQRSADQSHFRRMLHLKLRPVDPSGFFKAIMPHIGFFFTRYFVITAILLTVVAVGITVSNWGEYTTQAKGLFRPESIPTFLLVVFVVTGFHEFAHGLSCKHFGGEVHEIGFLLIYLLPAFYCNVSDAWLFREKWKRLWVSFAGVFFQIFIWSLATITWRVIDPETWLSDAACITMATSGLTTLFNLNPLIKLDGYYLLSDYLDVPNLRRKAFDYLGSTLRRKLVSAAGMIKEIPYREKKIYLAYGISAGIYSFGLLLFILLKIAGFVVSKFHGPGLAVLLIIITVAFTGSLERWTVRLRSLLKEGDGVNRRRKSATVTIVLAAVAVAMLVFGRWELKISNDCLLLAASRASIRAEVDGTIRELYVDCGDTVVPGGIIAQLDDSEYQSEIKKTQAEIAGMQAELDLLRKGPLREEVTRQRRLVEKAKTKVAYAVKEFDRVSELQTRGLAAPVEFEKAKEDLDVLRKELEHAESELEVLLKGHRPETIRAAEADLQRLNSTLEYLEHQMEKTSVTSSIRGLVSTPHLKDRLGEYVEAGDEICQIVDSGAMLVEIPVSEKDVADVAMGQRVRLKARSLPGQTFYGEVIAIAPAAANDRNPAIVTVSSRIENPEGVLKSGMTGNAKIYCGKRRIIDLWTRRMVRFIRVEFWL